MGLAPSNRLQARDAPAHDWYRFVLSFPAHLVEHYISRFELATDATILDPFCGTGTTLVEAKKLGYKSVGIEANPIAHFASKVKTNWDISALELIEQALDVYHHTEAQFTKEGIGLDSQPLRLDRGSYLTLNDEETSLLLRNSISPLPLHRILTLRNSIISLMKPALQSHALLALAKIAVHSASNLRFGPEVGLGKIKHDADVTQAWLSLVTRIGQDIDSLQAYVQCNTVCLKGDARDISSLIDAPIQAVITSPPYPNEKDYTRTTRLESVLLGFCRTKSELRELKKGLVRSNTRGVYKADTDANWIKNLPVVTELANAIEQRRLELGKTSGFEKLYSRVTEQYFGGMARHLASLRDVLAPGARLAYVVGDQASYFRVLIRTGEILAVIAKELGYEIEDIELFRMRYATATREQLREEVLLLRWNG